MQVPAHRALRDSSHRLISTCYTPQMSQPLKWVRASRVDDVPDDGAGHGFNLDGLDIVIFRWDEGVFALENFCPHLGFPLTEGIVQDGAVICGWHGWRVRLEDGGCSGKTLVARTFPCEIRGDEVWVEIPEKVGASGSE